MIAPSIKARVARGYGDIQPLKENRRQLGVYYTPPELSGIVSTWAVRKAGEKILEPSFGGCVFLRTIAESLKIKGARKITSHLFGCDVDALAFKHLKATFKDGFPKENFPKKSLNESIPIEEDRCRFKVTPCRFVALLRDRYMGARDEA